MAETRSPTLSGVSESLLVTLYIRAMESQRPDALIKDDNAVALVNRMSYDFERIRRIPLSDANKMVIILRNRQFDRAARAFLARWPQAAVVHIGCGLDARFERVDNGQVEWFDLDLPAVIALRRSLLGDERERYHLLACSALDSAWLDALSAPGRRATLFLAEGVFMYFHEPQVKALVLALRNRFPGAELIFDAYSPLHCLVHNLQVSTSGVVARVHWGIWRGRTLEHWGQGIRLRDEWGFMDEPEPRLAPVAWLRPFDRLARTLRIYNFRLGEEKLL